MPYLDIILSIIARIDFRRHFFALTEENELLSLFVWGQVQRPSASSAQRRFLWVNQANQIQNSVLQNGIGALQMPKICSTKNIKIEMLYEYA